MECGISICLFGQFHEALVNSVGNVQGTPSLHLRNLDPLGIARLHAQFCCQTILYSLIY